MACAFMRLLLCVIASRMVLVFVLARAYCLPYLFVLFASAILRDRRRIFPTQFLLFPAINAIFGSSFFASICHFYSIINQDSHSFNSDSKEGKRGTKVLRVPRLQHLSPIFCETPADIPSIHVELQMIFLPATKFDKA